MPFVEQTPQEWEKRARRVLLVGSPNTRKTSSLATWPADRFVLSYPGEKGTASIPLDAGTKSRVWQREEGEQDYRKIVKEIKDTTKEVLTGKHGPLMTFAGDGLHKLYQCFLAEATFGASMRGENFEPRLYGNASTNFFQYLDFVMNSQVENVVFTVWDGHEKDDPDDKGSSASRHIWPELPGQAAKRIVGEFSLVLHATQNAKGEYIWLTQPQGKVWGAGAKLPIEIAKRLPKEVPQDWAKLEAILFGG